MTDLGYNMFIFCSEFGFFIFGFVPRHRDSCNQNLVSVQSEPRAKKRNQREDLSKKLIQKLLIIFTSYLRLYPII